MGKRKARARAAEQSAPATWSLWAAAVLAAAEVLWAWFLWDQLLDLRRGADPFCPLGDPQACARIWDLPLAKAVHAWTGLPVAAWGLVWGLVALALPVWTGLRARTRRATRVAWSATLLTAVAGVGGVGVLLGASLLAGQLCPNCVAALAAGCAAVAFLVLLYPGLQTPRARPEPLGALPSATAPRPPPARPSGIAPDARRELAERQLAELIGGLRPELLQALSDALAGYASSEVVPPRPPRALIGAPDAPVRITEFSDILCGHCADLHLAVEQLVELTPPGSFALEPRHFPLDSGCNPRIQGAPERPVRCLAARALICLEDREGAFELAGELFSRQERLTEDGVYAAAARLIPRDQLQACVQSPETEAKLQDDIAWASQHGIRGTPLVLVNGREAPAFLPFLYAVVLSQGDPEHPAFEALPPPRS
jgi:serine/threonine-protein kinase